MQTDQPDANANVFTRSDTMLGVCEALGEDFGFNPLYLRATLGVLMIWYPVQVIAAYLAAGAIVLLSRLLFPKPRSVGAREAADTQPAAQRAPFETDNNMASEELAVAA